jgi:hypothetical protein
MSEKNYISGILIKKFGQYGQLNVSIKVADFVEQLQAIENNNGWANLVIAENRQPTEKGYTHHCFENTWKPETKDEPRKPGPYQAPEDSTPETNDDLPF